MKHLLILALLALLTACGGSAGPDSPACDFMGPTKTPRECPAP